jgi:endonuclease/exonuclease/phosphatase family metal-dependent hydrolase
MTYNMHTGIGEDGRLDLDRTAEAIRASGADVVGLQEVDVHWSSRSNFEDQAEALADKLGMNVFFAPIYSFEPLHPGEARREYGVAILSRYPILSAENHDITRLSTQTANPTPEPAPGFPEVVLNVRGVMVHVYNTHLDYRSDPTVRRMQVDDMLAIMGEDSEPKVLTGDMNAPPDAPELSRLFATLTDAWSARGSGAGLTYPAATPVKRIDDVLVSRDVGVESATVPDTLASDHRPTVAELSLPGEAVGGSGG